MNLRNRAVLLAALSTLAVTAAVAPAAQANVLSLLPGGCGSQPESQPFARWGDSANYTPVPGGNFEAGSPSWLLSRGASVVAGNESYNVGAAGDSRSLTLPAGSSATSLASCTSIYHPTARLFVRNTGSSSSRLKVEALYPGLLGGVQVAKLGDLTGSSSWNPSPAMPLLVSNLLATLSLDRTTIAFRFTPEDSTGAWSIDDVYLDPYARG
jgi:hypothetical protein